MIRPEIRSALWRWRDALIGAGVALIGLRWIVAGYGLMPWLGGLALVLGVLLIWVGLQRGLFRRDAAGPGVVTVDEGEITWSGPFSGGAMALADVVCVEFLRDRAGARWLLHDRSAGRLEIPAGSSGAEALFDAFTTLPHLNPADLLRAQRISAPGRQIVWQQNPGTRSPGSGPLLH